MLPAGNPAKSVASQPLVDVLPARADVDRGDAARHVAGLGVRRGREVRALDVGDRAGCGLLELGGPDLLEHEEVEGLDPDPVAGLLHALLDVLDGRVVAVGPGGPGAAVRVGDLLESPLVLHDPLERHAPEQAVEVDLPAAALAVRVPVAMAAAGISRRGADQRGQREDEGGQ